MKKIIPLVLISVLFSSCVWVPVTKNGSIREKTTMQSFDNVNNPLIVSFKVKDSFGLYGSTSLAEDETYVGSVLAVYDWENEKVIDYIYSPDVRSGVLPVVKDSNGKNVYYFGPFGHGKRVYSINSANAAEKGLEKISVSESEYVESSMADYSGTDSGKELVVYRKGFDNATYHTLYGARYIDSDTNQLGTEMEFSSFSNDWNFVPDKNGYIWFTYEINVGDDHSRKNTKLVRINTVENKIEEPLLVFDNYENAVYDINNGWSECDSYKVVNVTDDGIILLKSNYINTTCHNQKLIYVDKKTASVTDIANSSFDLNYEENLRCTYGDVVSCNGKILAFVHVYDSEANAYYYKVYELDLSGSKLEEASGERMNLNYYDSIKVFGDKVVFVKTDSDNAQFEVYDSTAGSFESKKTLSVKDFIENYTSL